MSVVCFGRSRWVTGFRSLAVITLLGVLAVSSAAGLPAAEEKEGEHRAATEGKKVDVDLTPSALAAQLAIQGERRKSPLLLLAAADIAGDLRVSERTADAVKPQLASGKTPAGRRLTLDMAALIQRARDLAKDNEASRQAVETMIAAIKSGSRGLSYKTGKDLPSLKRNNVVAKILNTKHTVLARGDTLTLSNAVFEGARPALVLVIGDGDGDLDLWVRDSTTGLLVGSDTDVTSLCRVAWIPPTERPYEIVVKNVGEAAEEFLVLANW